MTFKLVSPCVDPSFSQLKVCDLMLPLGSWNEDLIRSIFLSDDADIICRMATSSAGMDDKLIWHYDRVGRYTTKSSYHVAMSL